MSDMKNVGRGGVGSSLSEPAVIMALVIALVIGGVAGFFIGRQTSQPVPVQQIARQAPALPPGVTRLPPQVFGHWVLNCLQNAQNVKRCELSLRVVGKERRGVLLELLVGRNGKGKPVFVVVTPPNASLPAGVHLVFGNKPDMKVDFANCARVACRAVLPIEQDQQDALSQADTTQVTYVAGNGRNVSYKLPTDHFADAFAALNKTYPAPAQPAQPPQQ